jgi:perosamine synthetase
VIPLAIPNISGNEAAYLMECTRTNFVSSVGPFVTRLEQMVADAMGGKACAATSSGTTGLHAALIATGVEPGDLVLVPSFTFIASANAIAHRNAIPWFVDISADSWCISPLELARLLAEETSRANGQIVHRFSGRRVAAIMPVYTLGTPADMDPILGLAREYGLPVVADAAAALGARYKGRNLSGLADLSVLSFNGNKTVTAGGGGAIVGDDVTAVGLARHLTTTARVGDDYDHDRVGYNYRMTNLQAAVGCAQLERLEEFVAAKRKIRKRYDLALKELPGVGVFPQPAWADSGCWYSGLVLEDPDMPRADELCVELRRRGIGARTFWKPAHLQAPYREAPRTPLPITESTWDKVVTLPCSTQLTEPDHAVVISAVHDLLATMRRKSGY